MTQAPIYPLFAPIPIVERVIDYLRAAIAADFPDTVIAAKVPTSRPPSFVWVRKDGGGRIDAIKLNALIVYRCWAPTDTELDSLTDAVEAALLNATGHIEDLILPPLEESAPTSVEDESRTDTRYGTVLLTFLA